MTWRRGSSSTRHEVSIVPRGGTLGYCQCKEPTAATQPTRARYLSEMVKCLSGRAAEEVLLGVGDAGASSDLAKVACQWVPSHNSLTASVAPL